MRDFPAFTTENGVASLILREIPYTKRAYIRICSSLRPALLIDECVSFCRIAGAEEIFGCGDPELEKYPLHTAIITMRGSKVMLGDTDAALWPVQTETAEHWKNLYNQKAICVPNAAWMDDQECQRMLSNGDGYFVHRGGKLLGFGRVSGEELLWVASCEKGAGADVIRALAHAATSDTLVLDVASENPKALQLYQALGFVPVCERSRWFRLL